MRVIAAFLPAIIEPIIVDAVLGITKPLCDVFAWNKIVYT